MTELNVKQARQTLELSQSEFAAALNASKRTIEKWEQGERSPSPLVMKQIRVMLWLHSEGKWDDYLRI